MTAFVLPADRVHESARLCDYLIGRLDSDDTVHAVSTDSDSAPPEARRDSEDAQNAIYARLGATATVERHAETVETQADALRAVADRLEADEIVVIADKDETYDLLKDSRRPVVVVPSAGG